MDAFSVSLANGLNEPDMKRGKHILIAGTFAVFQGIMPLIGWICIHTIVTVFAAFESFIPWIALILLIFIGIKMIYDGVKKKSEDESEVVGIGIGGLIIQGIATSIDALSVGFTIADYDMIAALASALIIAAVTFIICAAGITAGRKFSMKLADKAQILGGLILIGIGAEIFITGVFL
ncbi:MAG: manganese efflux pump [Ruminiclostridium sp.]|nr:manganese efflux pump [Ruminiclostridium sp.]